MSRTHGMRTARGCRRVVLLAILPGLLACAGRLGSAPIAPRAGCCRGSADQTGLQYLGVGGWLIHHRGAALMTAPFFSNPGLVRVGVGWIDADPSRIEEFLPDVGDVETILVGHAHYDHLMDVPYIATNRAPRAMVYGSETARHQLAAAGLPRSRVVPLNGLAGDANAPGRWIYLSGGRMRFMALESDHAPHAFGVELYEGYRTRTPRHRPYWAGSWLKGQTFAYVIDLLDPNGQIEVRIHYADAASSQPNGFVPPQVLADRPADIVILCPPGSDEVDGYPGGILENVGARFALLGHWEDFFRPQSDLRVVPSLDLPKFLDELAAVGDSSLVWSLPEPGRVYPWPFDLEKGWQSLH